MLAKSGNAWGLLDAQPITSENARVAGYYTSFSRNFDCTHKLGDKPLSDLLTDAAYKVAATRVGPRLVEVEGERKDQTGNGLLKFEVTVVKTDDGKSAFIGESTGHWRDGDRSTVINVVNRIRQIDGKKLKLEESIENVKTTGPQGTEEFEYHRKFDIQERPPDADDSIFYLSHYGFPEPDFDDLEPAPKLHRFAWFFILLLAGVTLLVIARHARHAKTGIAA
jgi:hypothetical protein